MAGEPGRYHPKPRLSHVLNSKAPLQGIKKIFLSFWEHSKGMNENIHVAQSRYSQHAVLAFLPLHQVSQPWHYSRLGPVSSLLCVGGCCPAHGRMFNSTSDLSPGALSV